LGRNLKGWTRSDFFTEVPERSRDIRVPDEVPLTSKYYFRPFWWTADEELSMWEIFGDTGGDVGLSGLDDYVAKGIEHLFCEQWTSLICDSDIARERIEAMRAKLGIAEGWSQALIKRADRITNAKARKGPHKRSDSASLKTFASLFPSGDRFASKSGKPAWRIRGSGVSGPPEHAVTTRAVTTFLERSGIAVARSGVGGIGGGEIYTLEAPFLDGGVFAKTGIYFSQSKSAWVTGARAAMFVALGLGLRVSRRLQAELGLSGCTLDALRAEALTSQAPRRE
jgi:hypothetical protein